MKFLLSFVIFGLFALSSAQEEVRYTFKNLIIGSSNVDYGKYGFRIWVDMNMTWVTPIHFWCRPGLASI